MPLRGDNHKKESSPFLRNISFGIILLRPSGAWIFFVHLYLALHARLSRQEGAHAMPLRGNHDQINRFGSYVTHANHGHH